MISFKVHTTTCSILNIPIGIRFEIAPVNLTWCYKYSYKGYNQIRRYNEDTYDIFRPGGSGEFNLNKVIAEHGEEVYKQLLNIIVLRRVG